MSQDTSRRLTGYSQATASSVAISLNTGPFHRTRQASPLLFMDDRTQVGCSLLYSYAKHCKLVEFGGRLLARFF